MAVAESEDIMRLRRLEGEHRIAHGLTWYCTKSALAYSLRIVELALERKERKPWEG